METLLPVLTRNKPANYLIKLGGTTEREDAVEVEASYLQSLVPVSARDCA
jgi:hypothetical protein